MNIYPSPRGTLRNLEDLKWIGFGENKRLVDSESFITSPVKRLKPRTISVIWEMTGVCAYNIVMKDGAVGCIYHKQSGEIRHA